MEQDEEFMQADHKFFENYLHNCKEDDKRREAEFSRLRIRPNTNVMVSNKKESPVGSQQIYEMESSKVEQHENVDLSTKESSLTDKED